MNLAQNKLSKFDRRKLMYNFPLVNYQQDSIIFTNYNFTALEIETLSYPTSTLENPCPNKCNQSLPKTRKESQSQYYPNSGKIVIPYLTKIDSTKWQDTFSLLLSSFLPTFSILHSATRHEHPLPCSPSSSPKISGKILPKFTISLLQSFQISTPNLDSVI